MRGVNTKSKDTLKKLAVFVLLVFIILLLSNSVRKVYTKKRGAEETLARMNTEMQELKMRKESLEEFANRLQTNEGVEFELRKKFNVAGTGENVAIVVDENASSSGSLSPESLWQKLKDFVINLFE